MNHRISQDPTRGIIEPGSLEFQRSLVRGIFDASPDGILVVNDQQIVVAVNQRFFEVWGIPVNPGQSGEIIGNLDEPLLFMAVERVKNPKLFLERVKELYADPTLDDHCEVELKDGRTLERHSTVIRGGEQQSLGRVWFFRDISNRKQTEAELLELATHDPLTGVFNRRYFFDRAHKEFARARRYETCFSAIAIDIDHFKNINDQYGHAAGDEVLKALCECCQGVFRESDLFARLGGEEFCALVLNTGLGEALLTAERLRHLVMTKFVSAEGKIIRYTISIGVATLTTTDKSIENILQRADNALYRAKKNGRNQVDFEN